MCTPGQVQTHVLNKPIRRAKLVENRKKDTYLMWKRDRGPMIPLGTSVLHGPEVRLEFKQKIKDIHI